MNAAEEARQLKSQADDLAFQTKQAEAEDHRQNDEENRRLGVLRAEKEFPQLLANIKAVAAKRQNCFSIEIYGWRDKAGCSPGEDTYSVRLKELLFVEGFAVKDNYWSSNWSHKPPHWYKLDVSW